MTPVAPQARRARSNPTVRYVSLLWLLAVLLQRFVVPGLPVALLLPIVFAWAAWGLHRGLVELDRERLVWWSAAAGATALVVSAQLLFVAQPFISVTSWGLFLTVWAPFVLRLKDRRRETVVLVFRRVAQISTGLAVACIVMMAVQFAGLRYQDWLAQVVPAPLLFFRPFYVITYPLSYGSEIYRAHGFVGLEPSFVSAQIGLGLLAALLVGMSRRYVLVMAIGLVAAFSGSGFLLAGVGIVVLALTPSRHVLGRYVGPGLAVGAVLLVSPLGQTLFSRVTEAGSGRSSTSLRALVPYEKVWPIYVDSPLGVLLGRGPGSSQDAVDSFGIDGLLVPTPMKIFFDYGLLAGLLLAGFLLLCLLRAPSWSMSFTLLFSLWTLQPGTTTTLLVIPVLVLVTIWSPRDGPALEVEAFPERSRGSTGTPVLAQGAPTVDETEAA